MRKEKLEELNSYIEELQTAQKLKNQETGGFLNIESYDCYLKNGKKITREKIVKNNGKGSAATILPLTKEYNTILVVQPRVFTRSSVGIELPAGYIEKQEDKFEAALRELKEETGYVPKDIKLLASYYQDQGCMEAYNHSFIAFDCEKKSDQNLDQGEFIKYFECSFLEAIELAENGYINDVNSLFTLEKAKAIIKKRS